MPLDEIGINIKNNYAVLYLMDSTWVKKEKKSPPLSYEKLPEYTRMHITREQYNASFFPPKNTKLPSSNIQKQLSRKSQTRVRNSVNLLLECSTRKKVYAQKEKRTFSYKIGFMTLTLPEDFKMSDHDIHYKLFRPFIRRLQEQHKLAEYLWKAETQDNNQLHYHLTINVFIHWKKINHEWNQQIIKSGYQFKSANHERATTQIKSTKDVRNLGAYLCGYVAKKDIYKKAGRQFIKENYNKKGTVTLLPEGWFTEGGKFKKRLPEIKLWDCSENLKKEKLTLRNCNSNHMDILQDLAVITERELKFDFYSIWFFDREKMKQRPKVGALFDDYIQRIKYKNRQQENYTVETLDGNSQLN